MAPNNSSGASYRLAVATRYWHAARVLLLSQARPGEYLEPVGHLLNMAVELTLKSFLFWTGMTEKQISQKIGHDLEAALRRCIESGLPVSEEDARTVLTMRPSHLAHFHRYGPNFDNGLGHAILLCEDGAALRAAARLIDTASGDPRKLRDQHGRPSPIIWPITPKVDSPVSLERLSQLAAEINAEALKIADIPKQVRQS